TKLSSSTRTLGLEVLRANWLPSFPKRRLNTSMDLFAASPRPIHQCRTARRLRSSSFLKLPMLFVWPASCTPTKFWCSVGRKRLPRNKTIAETQVKMPQMGESIFEGTVTKGLKKKGDKVQRDEPLFEISTDKIDTEIPSPASGVLQDILVKEGQTVQINTTLAIIGDVAPKPVEVPKEGPPAPPASPPMTFTGEVERVPMTAMRKAIAEHMIMSRRTSAHVTTLFEVDCSRILKAKEKQQAEFERSGVKLT